jgi:uncharacterized damage-inducible protein DinB
MTIAENFLGEIESEARSTVRLLERVPYDQLDWRPHAKSMTLGDLAYHIADLPERATRFLATGVFDTANARPQSDVPRDTSAVDLFQRNLDSFRNAIGPMDNEQMMQPFRLLRGENVRELTKAAMVRFLLLNHSYHHRGQLSVYLRMLDVPLPATYGTSADEP